MILSCMKLYFPVSIKLFKISTNCQRKKNQPKNRIKSKLGKKKKKISSHSSCLTKPAVRISVGGTKLVC